MPYYHQDTTANDTAQLNQIITTFLTTNGWTGLYHNDSERETSATPTSSWRNTRYITSPLGQKFFLTTPYESADQSWIACGPLDDYTTSVVDTPIFNYASQSGYYTNSQTNDIRGPYTSINLFCGKDAGDDGEYMYCVVESVAGQYATFGFGTLSRIGTATAKFSVNTHWNNSTNYWRSPTNSRHSRPFDGLGNSQASSTGQIHLDGLAKLRIGRTDHFFGGYSGSDGNGDGGLNFPFFDDGPSDFNGRSMLMPCHVCWMDSGGDLRQIVGMAPAFRPVDIRNIAPKDTVDTDWKVFPLKAKNTASGVNSGNYGLAIRFQ